MIALLGLAALVLAVVAVVAGDDARRARSLRRRAAGLDAGTRAQILHAWGAGDADQAEHLAVDAAAIEATVRSWTVDTTPDREDSRG